MLHVTFFTGLFLQSYELIEDELKLSYHPQNAFCYHVDAKAPKEFRDKIENLAKCIPNVMVTSGEYDFSITCRYPLRKKVHILCCFESHPFLPYSTSTQTRYIYNFLFFI